METKERILVCLEETGIFVETDAEDVDLREYIVDSMQFISIVIAIEEAFQIEIPSHLLLMDNFMSMNSFCTMIDEIRAEMA